LNDRKSLNIAIFNDLRSFNREAFKLKIVRKTSLTEYENLGTTFHVKVTPKASSNKIKIEIGADGQKLIRVYVTAAAEDGKANKEVLRLLAKEFRIPQSSFHIVHGQTSRVKVIYSTFDIILPEK
jgi:uncharacterized protein (TIGR00251 family)